MYKGLFAPAYDFLFNSKNKEADSPLKALEKNAREIVAFKQKL